VRASRRARRSPRSAHCARLPVRRAVLHCSPRQLRGRCEHVTVCTPTHCPPASAVDADAASIVSRSTCCSSSRTRSSAAAVVCCASLTACSTQSALGRLYSRHAYQCATTIDSRQRRRVRSARALECCHCISSLCVRACERLLTVGVAFLCLGTRASLVCVWGAQLDAARAHLFSRVGICTCSSARAIVDRCACGIEIARELCSAS
jgi:hypothetical protein